MTFHYAEVGTSQTLIVKPNPYRKTLTIVCDDSTATIYILDSQGVNATNGLPIFSNGSATFSRLEGDDPRLPVWCISDTASTLVKIYEGFGIEPESKTAIS